MKPGVVIRMEGTIVVNANLVGIERMLLSKLESKIRQSIISKTQTSLSTKSDRIGLNSMLT